MMSLAAAHAQFCSELSDAGTVGGTLKHRSSKTFFAAVQKATDRL
jgi:hypothetical protein